MEVPVKSYRSFGAEHSRDADLQHFIAAVLNLNAFCVRSLLV